MHKEQVPVEVKEGLNQASFREQEYEDASWEVVGQFTGDEEFTPMEFTVVEASFQRTDPMFADYGGLPDENGHTQRWHQPGQAAYRPPRPGQGSPHEEEVVDTRLRISQEDLDKLIAEAEARGQAAGFEAAIEENANKFKQIETQLSEILTDLNNQFQESIANVEKQAVNLALNISEKIITFAVEINPEYIMDITRQALAQCGGARIKKVRVSPEDMEFIRVIGVEKRMKEFDGTWVFEKDDTIRSGCIVETSAGEVDYRLDEAWQRVCDEVVKVAK